MERRLREFIFGTAFRRKAFIGIYGWYNPCISVQGNEAAPVSERGFATSRPVERPGGPWDGLLGSDHTGARTIGEEFDEGLAQAGR